MKTVDPLERRDSDTRIWEKFGQHAEAITMLKAGQLQVRQDFMGHRAETFTHIEKLENEMHKLFASIEEKIIAVVKPLTDDVFSIKELIKKCTWVIVTAVAVAGFLGAILAFLIANFTSFSNIFQHG